VRDCPRPALVPAGIVATAVLIAASALAQTITRGPFIQNPDAVSTTMTRATARWSTASPRPWGSPRASRRRAPARWARATTIGSERTGPSYGRRTTSRPFAPPSTRATSSSRSSATGATRAAARPVSGVHLHRVGKHAPLPLTLVGG